jgi:hypothetical protein
MKARLAELEAVAALALAWVLVFVVPFRWTRRLFGTLSAPEPIGDADIPPADLARARAVTGRLRRRADRLPWPSTCLVRALAGRMLLSRRGLTGAIVRLGIRRGDERCIDAHAWLILGPAILLGGAKVDTYRALGDLAARSR